MVKKQEGENFKDTESRETFSEPYSMGYGGGGYENEQEPPSLGIIKELSPYNDIVIFEHYLKGEIKNPESGLYEKSFKPFFNENGYNYIIGIFSGLMSQTLRTTYLTREEADELISYAIKSLIPTIQVNFRDFGVTDPTLLPSIYSVILIQMKAVVNKAIRGGERNFIRGTVSENIMNRFGSGSESQAPRKRGFWPWSR